MIKIENAEIVGWEPAIRGMRNPMNSWNKSDSKISMCSSDGFKPKIEIGGNDLSLMMRLRDAGTDHRKYLRMIICYADITAPLYWWKEFDTYKVGTVANSCSTMHKIADKEFTLEDFSYEHLTDDIIQFEIPETENDDNDDYDDYVMIEATSSYSILCELIGILNAYRELYIDTKDKRYWWQMIQLLPSSYNQRRTVMLNYEVLANQYKSRKNHRLDEWRDFCEWIKTLPYSELITGEENDQR